MFKRLLVILMMASVSTAALADGGRHHNQRHHNHGYHNHRHHNHNQWVAPLIGGIILGEIITRNSQPVYVERPQRYYYEQPRRQYCYDSLVTEYDRWGNPYQYYVRRCN